MIQTVSGMPTCSFELQQVEVPWIFFSGKLI